MSTEPRHARPVPAEPEDATPDTSAAQAQESAGETPPAQVPASPLPEYRVRRTRISGLWVAIGFFAVVLLLLLIFILQNPHTVEVSYFGFHGHLPLGVALLLAAVCGVLLVGLAGTARILQLRAAARRHHRTDAKAVKIASRRDPVS